MNALQKSWIEHGYQVFASQGPPGLKIERLARKMGKNKSSFYHHFADLEVFTGLLLDYHLEQARLLARKESGCETAADLIEVLVEHKTDLLFSRQLRVHREKPAFEACFVKTNQISLPALQGVWSEIIELKDNSHLSGLVLGLSLENFFLQITDDHLNKSWLANYFHELRTLVRAFKNHGPGHHQTVASKI
jgi:AcrR family transcriptional regulator